MSIHNLQDSYSQEAPSMFTKTHFVYDLILRSAFKGNEGKKENWIIIKVPFT